MKFQLSALAILGSVALSHGQCIRTSGNAHMVPDTGEMKIFALVYYSNILRCSIDRATYDNEMKLDCHDGHYSLIPEDLTVVMYSHNRRDYRIPISPVVTGEKAWAWNGEIGC